LLGEPDSFSKLEKLGLNMIPFLLGKLEPFLLSCGCDVDSRQRNNERDQRRKTGCPRRWSEQECTAESAEAEVAG
jgi:hypothetical protein